MTRQEIVYRDNNGVMKNVEFESFEKALPLINKLDRQNKHYDWYEFVGGQWHDATEVTVLQGEDISRYIAGQVA
jgi:hypothetical protein